jgi:hypothetical protein
MKWENEDAKYQENEGPYEALTSGNAALLFIDH